MFSPGYIRQLQREAAERACEEGLEPFVPFTADELDEGPPFPFPFLGDHIPEGWTLEERLFCDSSGVGRDSEPALSVRQFVRKAKQLYRQAGTCGFAVVQAGQFQCYVGVYRRVR